MRGLWGLLIAVPALLLAPTIIFVLSRVDGWHTLARRYPRAGPRPPARVRLGYGVFRGWIGYNGGLVIAVDHRGLCLSAMPVILSWCHPPVFIPWAEIVEIRRARSLRVFPTYRIHTRQAHDVDVALRPGTFDRIRDDVRRAGVPGGY